MRFKTTILLVLLTTTLFSQVDNEFWLAPPSAYLYDVGDESDIELVITAMQATVVTIEQPATGFSYTTPTIGSLSSLTVNLGSDLGLNMTDIETPPQTLPLGGLNPAYTNGFKITSSPGLVTVSYKLTNDKSQDQVSLKGKNALGNNFYVSTQNLWPGVTNNNYNGFTIVATQNNTTIEIERNNVWTAFPGPFPATETLVLNEGETYTIQSVDETAANHINGVHVSSDNDIAITVWDDQVSKYQSAGKRRGDFASDQLVPTSILGQEYIVMKGGLRPAVGDGGESVFITGTVDGTFVEVTDSAGQVLNSFTINEGEVIYDTIDNFTTYIRASEIISVNHYTSIFGSQLGLSMALAVLPKVGPCTGSHDVIITRSAHAGDRFLLNILAVNDTLDGSSYKNQAINNFFITTSSGVTQIPPSYFKYSSDSSYITLDARKYQADFLSTVIDVGMTALIQNRIAKFHLGIIEGHENQGSKYGYFSDYGGQSARAGVGGPDEDGLHVQCSMNPVRLVITGGRTYQWWVDGADSANSSNYLSDLNIAEPLYYPDTFGVRIFKVKASQLCGGIYENTMVVYTLPKPTAYFEVEAEEVCSPDSILVTHGITLPNVNINWYFNNNAIPGRSENTDDPALPFYHVLPSNTGDSLYSYRIDLQTNYLGACTDSYSRTITVKPAIHSSFEFLGDSVDCHPLSVQLKNNSSGNVDSTSYFWDFGDYTISYEEDSVEHTFQNYSQSDTTYDIKLITRSPFDCLDTSSAQVTVFPRVKALFSTTPNLACSPLIFDINPVNSLGADSLFWNIDYFYTDSSFVRTNKNSMTVTHYDTSISSGPDTLHVSLIAKNDYGCADTAVPHQLVAFPSSTAEFDISESVICDGDSILFHNNSDGYNLDFYWSLGDGTAPNDSVPASKLYYNPSSTDVEYLISLTVISDNNCIDSKDTILTVHPYIDANFGINYVKNCSPLSVSITDNAFGADIYSWDLGDGATYANSDDFTHSYLNPHATIDTNYTIKLTVENNEGCTDSITRILTVKPQVVAALNIADKLGCSPLSPTFQNLSQGGSYYIWNLGGNNLRTDTTALNFSEVYTNGTGNDIAYPISLTAMNTAGCDSTVYDTVEVYADILTSFTFAKDSSCSPFLPTITNNSGGGAKVFEWYQDGVLFSTDNTPILPTYTNGTDSPESFLFTLIAYGEDDAPHKICADTHSLNLKIFPHLTTSFTLNDLASCQPLNTTITNLSNLQDSTQFKWHLDNYIYSPEVDPGNLFINNFSNNDINHNFKLTGRTNHGCTDTSSVNVDVYAYINANFTVDKPEICSGDSFGINRLNTSGAIDTYLWNFDGLTSNNSNGQFNYSFENTSSSPLIKPITLTVSNANCDSSWSGSIQVNPLVTANFEAAIDSGCHPHATAFNNMSINGNVFNWTFGDGVNSTETDPIHTFNNYDPADNKSFDIRLISESMYRCRDTAYGKITSFAKPIANFIMPISVSCPPFNFSVINNSEGSNSMNYLWKLGTNTYTDFEPSQVFDNTTPSLRYENINLTVTSEDGCSDSISQEITVYPKVNVDFTANPPTGCSPLEVNFNGDTLNVQQLVWYIDNKLYSAQVSPTKLFLNETGEDILHDIKLMAYSRYNCIDSTKGNVTVFATPVSDFSVSPVPAVYDTLNDLTNLTIRNFTQNQSSWNYNWEFGDGNSGDRSDAVFDHQYEAFFWGPKEKNFRIPVTLVSSNPRHPACKDTIIHEALLLPPVPLVDIGDEISGCIPLTIDFSAYTKYAKEGTYEWNFGDGSSILTEETPTYTFNKSGTFTVKLNIEGDGGPAADYKVITVYPQPIADFSFNDTVVFVASQTKDDDRVNFYNQTKYGVNYEWFFDLEDFLSGSAPNSLEKDPIWAYDEIGKYYPVLIAYSGEGCSDTLISSNYIKVLGEGVLEFPTGFFTDPRSAPADEYNTSQITPNMYIFYPKNNGVAKYKLEIYNRWGTLIFETDDVNRGWNGYFDGTIAKQDVYIWRAKGNFTNGQPFDISGDVTLFHTPVNTNP